MVTEGGVVMGIDSVTGKPSWETAIKSGLIPTHVRVVESRDLIVISCSTDINKRVIIGMDVTKGVFKWERTIEEYSLIGNNSQAILTMQDHWHLFPLHRQDQGIRSSSKNMWRYVVVRWPWGAAALDLTRDGYVLAAAPNLGNEFELDVDLDGTGLRSLIRVLHGKKDDYTYCVRVESRVNQINTTVLRVHDTCPNEPEDSFDVESPSNVLVVSRSLLFLSGASMLPKLSERSKREHRGWDLIVSNPNSGMVKRISIASRFEKWSTKVSVGRNVSKHRMALIQFESFWSTWFSALSAAKGEFGDDVDDSFLSFSESPNVFVLVSGDDSIALLRASDGVVVSFAQFTQQLASPPVVRGHSVSVILANGDVLGFYIRSWFDLTPSFLFIPLMILVSITWMCAFWGNLTGAE